jgi:hypothetical protein
MMERTAYMDQVGDWVREVMPDGHTREDDLRNLFLELENALRKMDLLRADYKTYKTLHFAEFCAEIYSHCGHGTQ